MAIIKAKYPQIGHEDFSFGIQGFGSLYGGNHASVVSNLPTEKVIVETHDSDFA